MNKPQQLLQRLHDIGASLAATDKALVALHRAAFGTDHMTAAERRAMMSAPDYDPELDLVVVAPDGRLAGFCVCGIPVEENAVTRRNEGYADPVGVHPAFQGRDWPALCC
jgi:mycothiol synthase